MRASSSKAPADHPRSRGEYRWRRVVVSVTRGSSPLSRGIPSHLRAASVLRRIIPALAGNTRRPGGRTHRDWDHPRSRGEYTSSHLGGVCLRGSSPLSRGILVDLPLLSGRLGIIPALAGNTLLDAMDREDQRDHPRSRGEYSAHDRVNQVREGSSPLSRGIPGTNVRGSADRGIIPALAGNTSLPPQQPSTTPDHPRSRGEYGFDHPALPSAWGSSPLSRGIQHSRRLLGYLGGIIPALAGNTWTSRDRSNPRRDHPRSRGEYCLRALTTSSGYGSSPLSRGIPRRHHVRANPQGIIPALAGNTPSR